MITATYKGQYLELSEDLQIEKVRKSQLLSFDKLKGDHVPAFSVLNTPHNRNVLNHPNMVELERKGKLEYTDFYVVRNGWPVIFGTFVVEDGNDKSFDGYIRGVLGNLSNECKEKSIRKFNLPLLQQFENKNYYDPSVDDYCCFSLSNEYFFKDIGNIIDEDNERSRLQLLHKNMGFDVNRYNNGSVYIAPNGFSFSEDLTEEITVVSPFLFLFRLVELLMMDNNFYLSRNDIADDNELMQIALYHNKDIIFTTGVTSQTTASKEYSGRLILSYARSRLLTANRVLAPFNYKDCLPDVTLKEFLLGIQNELNIAFVFNEDNTYNIIDRDGVLIGSSIDLDQYLVSAWETGTKKNVCLKFIQNHDDKDKLFSDFFVDLSDRLDDFGDPVANETDLENITGSFLGELRVVEGQKVFEWCLDVVDTDSGIEDGTYIWKFISNMFQPYFYNYKDGREVEEIETVFSTLFMDAGYPVVMQKGQSNLRKSEGEIASPRLMFYQGAGFASNESETNYSFDYSNDLALPKTRWKYFNKFWAYRLPIEAKFDLPVSILMDFDINKKYRTKHGEFIIEEMRTPMTHTKIGKTTIEGFKVDFEDENTD